jgi:hypothetical protein
MDNPDRLPHLARLAEAHDPEPTQPRRMPSGWWLLPALIVSVGLSITRTIRKALV